MKKVTVVDSELNEDLSFRLVYEAYYYFIEVNFIGPFYDVNYFLKG